jgi:hypothetical protein
MRNLVVNALPAGTTLLVTVEPPIGPNEVPYLFTAMGPGSVVVRVVDDAHVELKNPIAHLSPFMFFVGPKLDTLPPPWLKTVLSTFGGSR